MNFLFHFYLSYPDKELVTGNFLGEFVKGKKTLDSYPPGIRKGIAHHRAIDHYSDSHDSVRFVKRLFIREYNHSARILPDVFFDHCLARKWSVYHEKPLKNFARETYFILEEHKSYFSEKANHAFYHMKNNNWLYNYAQPEGINRTLEGISSRLRVENKLGRAYKGFLDNEAEIVRHFDLFRQDIERWQQDYFSKESTAS